MYLSSGSMDLQIMHDHKMMSKSAKEARYVEDILYHNLFHSQRNFKLIQYEEYRYFRALLLLKRNTKS